MFKSTWYYSLIKPFLAPPDWIFTPVWIFLYITIFIAFLLFMFKKAENKKYGYIFFILQMIFNVIWPFAFFGIQNLQLALFIIIILDLFVFLTIRKFYDVSKISGLILIPYLIWCIFATYLNIGYLVLNS